MKTLLLTAALGAAAAPASADAMGDKLCPILASVAAGGGGMMPEATQAQLVVAVAGAYDYDHDALSDVLAGADAATTAACPDARAAVLQATNKPSLEAAMR